MRRVRRRAAHGLATGIACLGAATALPSSAAAALTLTTSAAPLFSDNLNAGDQTQAFTAALNAKDTSSGSSPGWHLTITSTTFTTGGASPHTLSNTATKITSVAYACASGPCVNPVNSVALPVTVPAGSVAPAAVSFFDAAANTGQGSFTVTPTFNVFVPQNSFAGTYTSKLTFAIVSGP